MAYESNNFDELRREYMQGIQSQAQQNYQQAQQQAQQQQQVDPIYAYYAGFDQQDNNQQAAEQQSSGGLFSGLFRGAVSGGAGVIGGQAEFGNLYGIGDGSTSRWANEVAQNNARRKQYSIGDMIPFASDYWTNGEGAAFDIGNALGSGAVLSAETAAVLSGAGAVAGALGIGGVGAAGAAGVAGVGNAARGAALGRYAIGKVANKMAEKAAEMGLNTTAKVLGGPTGQLLALNILQTPFEVSSEMGNAGQEALARGENIEEARRQAWVTGATQAPLLALSNTLEVGRLGKILAKDAEKVGGMKKLMSAIGGITGEAFQNAWEEGMQQSTHEYAAGAQSLPGVVNPFQWSPEAKLEAAAGFTGGFGTGAGYGMINHFAGGKKEDDSPARPDIAAAREYLANKIQGGGLNAQQQDALQGVLATGDDEQIISAAELNGWGVEEAVPTRVQSAANHLNSIINGDQAEPRVKEGLSALLQGGDEAQILAAARQLGWEDTDKAPDEYAGLSDVDYLARAVSDERMGISTENRKIYQNVLRMRSDAIKARDAEVNDYIEQNAPRNQDGSIVKKLPKDIKKKVAEINNKHNQIIKKHEDFIKKKVAALKGDKFARKQDSIDTSNTGEASQNTPHVLQSTIRTPYGAKTKDKNGAQVRNVYADKDSEELMSEEQRRELIGDAEAGFTDPDNYERVNRATPAAEGPTAWETAYNNGEQARRDESANARHQAEREAEAKAAGEREQARLTETRKQREAANNPSRNSAQNKQEAGWRIRWDYEISQNKQPTINNKEELQAYMRYQNERREQGRPVPDVSEIEAKATQAKKDHDAAIENGAYAPNLPDSYYEAHTPNEAMLYKRWDMQIAEGKAPTIKGKDQAVLFSKYRERYERKTGKPLEVTTIEEQQAKDAKQAEHDENARRRKEAAAQEENKKKQQQEKADREEALDNYYKDENNFRARDKHEAGLYSKWNYQIENGISPTIKDKDEAMLFDRFRKYKKATTGADIAPVNFEEQQTKKDIAARDERVKNEREAREADAKLQNEMYEQESKAEEEAANAEKEASVRAAKDNAKKDATYYAPRSKAEEALWNNWDAQIKRGQNPDFSKNPESAKRYKEYSRVYKQSNKEALGPQNADERATYKKWNDQIKKGKQPTGTTNNPALYERYKKYRALLGEDNGVQATGNSQKGNNQNTKSQQTSQPKTNNNGQGKNSKTEAEFQLTSTNARILNNHPFIKLLRKLGYDVRTDEQSWEESGGKAKEDELLRAGKDDVPYGAALGNTIYLNPRGINPDTPIHEFIHLWVKMIIKKNPKLWKQGLELLKKTKTWEATRRDSNYQFAKLSDEEIYGNEEVLNRLASEVMARIGGERGAYRAQEMQKKLEELNESKGIISKIINWFGKLFHFTQKEVAPTEDLANMSVWQFIDKPIDDIFNGLKAVDVAANNEKADGNPNSNEFQIAYHGSPYSFDKFMSEHIGEGEGGQAHGWGLYFSLDKNVARGYRDDLSNPEKYNDEPNEPINITIGNNKFRIEDIMLGTKVFANGKPTFNESLMKAIVNLADFDYYRQRKNNGSIKELISRERGRIAHYNQLLQSESDDKIKEYYKDQLKNIADNIRCLQKLSRYGDAFTSNMEEAPTFDGKLYEVDIPEDDLMLKESSKLGNQPKKVLLGIQNLLADIKSGFIKGKDKLRGRSTFDGGQFYDALVAFTKSPQEASMLLNQYGIKGIRYNGERDGQCAVVFDDKAIDLLHRYNMQDEMEFQIAYHGSPYKFDRFTTERIGHGEGSQKHGWGMYFTKDKEFGRSYRDNLGNKDGGNMSSTIKIGNNSYKYVASPSGFGGFWTKNGENVDQNESEALSALLNEPTGNPTSIKEFRKTFSFISPGAEKALDGLQEVSDTFVASNKSADASLYEVDVPEDNAMITESAALNEQPQGVQKALKKLGFDTKEDADLTGKQIYNSLVKQFGTPKAASTKLLSVGIEGISYYSVTDGNGLVVFNDSAAKVMHRYNANDEMEFQVAGFQAEAVRDKYKGTKQWMKAPNGKPTNLTEDQWCQVRTKNFKDWFGDWENDPENASKVVDENGEPLVQYHGSDSYGFKKFNTKKVNSNYGAHFGTKGQAMNFDENGDKTYAVFLNIKNPWEADFDYFAGFVGYAVHDIAYMAQKINTKEAREIVDNLAKYFPDVKIKNGDKRYDAIDEFQYDGYDTMLNDVPGNNFREQEQYVEKIVDKAYRDMLNLGGYDGVKYWNMYEDEGKGDSWIIQSPNNVKSATNNNGDFSKLNDDIEFAIAKKPQMENVVNNAIKKYGRDAIVEKYSDQILSDAKEDDSADDNGTDSNSATTQVEGTRSMYVKALAHLLTAVKPSAKRVLDFSAGLGFGTMDMREAVKDKYGAYKKHGDVQVDSYEIFPKRWFKRLIEDYGLEPMSKEFDSQAPTISGWDNLQKLKKDVQDGKAERYDVILNTNVLNVVDPEVRDTIVSDICFLLADGGVAAITTRGWKGDVASAIIKKRKVNGSEKKVLIDGFDEYLKDKDGNPLIENNGFEQVLLDGNVKTGVDIDDLDAKYRAALSQLRALSIPKKIKGKDKPAKVYQKGFDGDELVDYINGLIAEKFPHDKFTVKKVNSLGEGSVKSGVIIIRGDTESVKTRDIPTTSVVKKDDPKNNLFRDADTFENYSGESIGRSRMGVGKDVDGNVYFHKDYVKDMIEADLFTQEEYDNALEMWEAGKAKRAKWLEDAKKNYPKKLREAKRKGSEESIARLEKIIQWLGYMDSEWDFNCITYMKSTGAFRFDEAPDFDTAREPIPARTFLAPPSSVTKTDFEDQIWHHKWNWVDNNYQERNPNGFDVQESIAWSKQWASKEYDAKAIGRKNKWDKHLAKNGLPVEPTKNPWDSAEHSVAPGSAESVQMAQRFADQIDKKSNTPADKLRILQEAVDNALGDTVEANASSYNGTSYEQRQKNREENKKAEYESESQKYQFAVWKKKFGRDDTYIKSLFSKIDDILTSIDRMAKDHPALMEWNERDIGQGIRVSMNGKDVVIKFRQEVGRNDSVNKGKNHSTTVGRFKFGHLPVRSSFMTNGEYELNIDLGTLCTKRESMDTLIEVLKQSVGGRGLIDNLGATQFEALKNLLKSKDFMVACDICFVESKRVKALNDAVKWAYEWKSVLTGMGLDDNVQLGDRTSLTKEQKDKLDAMAGVLTAEEDQACKDSVSDIIDKKKRDKELAKARAAARDAKTQKAYDELIPSENKRIKKPKRDDDGNIKYDDNGNIIYGDDLDSGITIDKMQKIAKLLREDTRLCGDFDPHLLMTTRGTDWLFRTYGHTNIAATIAGMFGSATAKPLESFAIYDPLSWYLAFDSKELNADFLNHLYDIGGFRAQSFTDFNSTLFFDYIQLMADLEARNLPIHMYTKVPALADLFGKMGAKINMSLVAEVAPKPEGMSDEEYKAHVGLRKATADEIKAVELAKKKGKKVYEDMVARNSTIEMDATADDVKAYEYAKNRSDDFFFTKLANNGFVTIDGKQLRVYDIKNGKKQVPVVNINKDGWTYAWADESFPTTKALDIRKREGYDKNCGIIAVALSVEHGKMLRDDPNIDYIIPFHASGMANSVKVKTGLISATDFTNFQTVKVTKAVQLEGESGWFVLYDGTDDVLYDDDGNEVLGKDGKSIKLKDSNDKAKDAPHFHHIIREMYDEAVASGDDKRLNDFLENAGDMAAQRYLEECKKRKYVPIFEQFAYEFDDDGNVIMADGKKYPAIYDSSKRRFGIVVATKKNKQGKETPVTVPILAKGMPKMAEGYFKFLEDFRVYDDNHQYAPQVPVRLTNAEGNNLPENWETKLRNSLYYRPSSAELEDKIRNNKELMDGAKKILSKQRLDAEARELVMKKLSNALGSDNIISKRQSEFLDEMQNAKAESIGASKAKETVDVFRNGNGIIYGYAYKGKIYLNEDVFNANTPAHEFTHVWAKVVQAVKPELWSKIKNLLASDPKTKEVWDTVVAESQKPDSPYSHINEMSGEQRTNAIASETLSRIIGGLNERVVRNLIDGKYKPLKSETMMESIYRAFDQDGNFVERQIPASRRLVNYIRRFFAAVRAVFSGNQNESFDALSIREIVLMPMRAIYDDNEAAAFKAQLDIIRENSGVAVNSNEAEFSIGSDPDMAAVRNSIKREDVKTLESQAKELQTRLVESFHQKSTEPMLQDSSFREKWIDKYARMSRFDEELLKARNAELIANGQKPLDKLPNWEKYTTKLNQVANSVGGSQYDMLQGNAQAMKDVETRYKLPDKNKVKLNGVDTHVSIGMIYDFLLKNESALQGFMKETGDENVIQALDSLVTAEGLIEDYNNNLKAHRKWEEEGEKGPEPEKYIFPEGTSLETCKKVVAKSPVLLRRAADMYYKFNNDLIHILHNSGVITTKELKTYEHLYHKYCPLMRDFSDTQAMENYFSDVFGGGGVANVSNPLKHRSGKGSSRKVLSPIVSTAFAVRAYLTRAERNMLMQDIINTSNKYGLTDLIHKDDSLEAGIKDSAITVRVDGKKQTYWVDKDLYGPLTNTFAPTVRVDVAPAVWAATLLREGATSSPSFILRNFIKDSFTASIYSNHNFIPIYHSLKYLDRMLKDEAFRTKVYSRGISKSAQFISREDFEKEIQELTKGKKDFGLYDMAKSILKYGWGKYSGINALVETCTRAGLMDLAEKDGATVEEAVYDALWGTLNFNVSGTAGQQINRIIPFFNACIQGGDMMYRLFKDDWQGTCAKIGKYIIAPTLMLWLANSDEDWYKDLDSDVKMKYWCFPGGFRIPKPEMAILFGSGMEAALNEMSDKDPKAARHWKNSAFSTMLPNFIPTAALPLIEWMANYSFFMDKPIVNASMARLPAEKQYGNYTSAGAIKAGELLGVSPAKLENAYRNLTGTMGMLLLQSTDFFDRDKMNLPEKKLTEYPLLRDFFVNDVHLRRQINDFFELAAAADSFHRDKGIPGKPTKEVSEINKAKTMIGKAYRMKKEVEADPRLSPAQKRAKTDKIDKDIKRIATNTVQKYGKKFDIT